MNEIEILKNINNVIPKFDGLVFDAFGVFRLNDKISQRAIGVMANAVKMGKPLYVVSNTTERAAKAVASYHKKGVFKGIHFTDIVTSGEVGHQLVMNGDIPIKNKNVWVLGNSNPYDDAKIPQALEGTGVTIVDNIEDADIAYCGTPRINGQDIEYDPTKSLFENAMPFIKNLETIHKHGLTLVGFNSDLNCFVSGIQSVRQGTIIGAYQEMGGDVILSGKPNFVMSNENNGDGYVLGGENLVKSGDINLQGKKVWVLGQEDVVKPLPGSLEETGAKIVPHMENADIIYCGIPKINNQNIEFDPKKNAEENAMPFMKILEKAKQKGLTLVAFNPDASSFESGVRVVRQGTISEAYKSIGGEIVVSGKPDSKMFRHVLNELDTTHNVADKNKIMMVGDSLAYDIMGANQAGIKSCLLLKYGVSYMDFLLERKKKTKTKITRKDFNKEFQEFIARYKVTTDYIAQRL